VSAIAVCMLAWPPAVILCGHPLARDPAFQKLIPPRLRFLIRNG